MISFPAARRTGSDASLPQRAHGAAVALAALAAVSLSPDSAHAYVVTVNSIQYDETTFTGSFSANTSKFATPANGGVLP